MKNLIIVIAAVFILTACEKTVYLDLDKTNPKVVIEGMITDRENMQFVKVSRSAGFYSTGGTPKITDATVRPFLHLLNPTRGPRQESSDYCCRRR